MNIPYVKTYNLIGEVTNPIEGSYINNFANRKQRRAKPMRFKSNRSGVSLTISENLKYHRIYQIIKLIDGTIKRIGHYVLSH